VTVKKAGPPLAEGALQARLKTLLKDARYEHTRGVVVTATALAEAHGLNVAAVRTAAWLHDAAKSLSPTRQKSLAKQAGADPHELSAPSLWHAAASCMLAQQQFAVKDPAILQAIRFHTTGAPSLGPIAKAIYVADYSEPGRRYKGTKKLRKLALEDLQAAYLAVLREKLGWVLYKRQALHPRTVEAYNEAVQTAR
jgi:predicted HD superfamily hydrolase involved in NAD metabolism